MIENWKKAYKFYSVQAAVVFALLVELVLLLVPRVAEHPAFAHHAPVLLTLVAFARIVSQSKKPTDPNVLIDAAARAGATLKKGSAMIVLLACVGCAQRQPVDIQALVQKANMPEERAVCLIATETAYQLRKKVCGKNRKGACSTDWLIDKQHEEIDVCFSNF